jgi:uncharacterized protein (DUF433 family)
MSREYIERRNESYYVAGTRVSLESVVHRFREGASPETILQRFPALGSLANVYGAIAFALANPELVEKYLAEQQSKWESIASSADPAPQGLSRDSEATFPAR